MLLTLTISTFFIHVPHIGAIGFVLNPEVTLSYNQYFWMLCEHLIMVILALIIREESRDYRRLVEVYVMLQVLDVFAFILAYDDPFKDYYISFNMMKIIVFILAIAIEYGTTGKTRKQP
jgi:hypothetical protein